MFFVYITCRIEIKFYLLTYSKQAKHETKNKQKATKIQKLKHLAISIEFI
jgi:hypothetical protein